MTMATIKSLEEKAKRYDEVLKQIKEWTPDENGFITIYPQEIFPELKESEDERDKKIRKKLIEYFKSFTSETFFNGVPTKDAIAWLEKQGEQSSLNTNQECLKGIKRVQEYQDLSDWEKIFDSIASKYAYNKNQEGYNNSWYIKERAAEMLYHAKKELEKQGEQKPIDKVEPKFEIEEGKWYICISQFCNCIEGRVYKATSDSRIIDDFGTEYDMHNDAYKYFRLWTIQDAKDGDILHSIGWHNDCIFIFNGLDKWKFDAPNGDRAVATGYCCLSVLADNMEFGIQGPDCIEVNTVKPATKIQRDLLFQKMHEAGYEWDSEKKELKKIEQKPADSVIEEEKPLLEKFKQAVYDCAWGKVTCKKEGETQEEYANRWAEHFFLIVRDWADDYIDYTIQQKLRNSYEKGKADIIEKQNEQKLTEWSEEDERKIDELIALCKGRKKLCSPAVPAYKRMDELKEWLNSLKDRVQPQLKQEWSEEDEKMFNTIGNSLDRGRVEGIWHTTIREVVAWLKILKDKIQSQQEWNGTEIAPPIDSDVCG